jgi:hypothetical protein
VPPCLEEKRRRRGRGEGNAREVYLPESKATQEPLFRGATFLKMLGGWRRLRETRKNSI